MTKDPVMIDLENYQTSIDQGASYDEELAFKSDVNEIKEIAERIMFGETVVIKTPSDLNLKFSVDDLVLYEHEEFDKAVRLIALGKIEEGGELMKKVIFESALFDAYTFFDTGYDFQDIKEAIDNDN